MCRGTVGLGDISTLVLRNFRVKDVDSIEYNNSTFVLSRILHNRFYKIEVEAFPGPNRFLNIFLEGNIELYR